MMPFFPHNHYWIIGGSETDVYSSASNTLVPQTDQAYVDWAAANMTNRIETEAELADVLKPYSFIPHWLFNAPSFIQPAPGAYDQGQLKAYSADARWRKEQGGMVTTAGFPQKTDDRAQAKITGTYTAQNEVPAVTTKWHAADGVVHDLDGPGLYQLHVDLLTHINACFDVSAANITAIDAGSMTTLEEIDATYGAPMSTAQKNWLKK